MASTRLCCAGARSHKDEDDAFSEFLWGGKPQVDCEDYVVAVVLEVGYGGRRLVQPLITSTKYFASRCLFREVDEVFLVRNHMHRVSAAHQEFSCPVHNFVYALSLYTADSTKATHTKVTAVPALSHHQMMQPLLPDSGTMGLPPSRLGQVQVQPSPQPLWQQQQQLSSSLPSSWQQLSASLPLPQLKLQPRMASCTLPSSKPDEQPQRARTCNGQTPATGNSKDRKAAPACPWEALWGL